MDMDTKIFKFQEYWPEAIVVYPQGLETRKSAAGPYGWQHEAGEFGDRDLKFFDAMLATLHEKYRVDDSRIYASGFSDGARHTYYLWSVRPKVFAAFAIVAGQIAAPVKLIVPKPVYYSAGKKDGGFEKIMEAINTVRALNEVAETGEPCGEDCTAYPSKKGAPIVTYIHPYGHVYPLPISPKFVEFFKHHTLAD
jgi:polyhydroxybutyrate depolymerase